MCSVFVFNHVEIVTKQFYHCGIKAIEVCKEIVLIVHQRPLTASVLVTPAVSFTREINPFGMSEFVTHKGKVTAVNGRSGDKANHLVKCYSTIHHVG